LYSLFSEESEWFPSRLNRDLQRKIEDLLWSYALAKSTTARADLKYVWFIQGSENHDLMDLGNAFLALQALKGKSPYKEIPLQDGKFAKEHVEAWTAYFTEYARQRSRYGLSIEIASPIYGKYFIPELFNLYDFSEDPGLRDAMKKYLDLIWADWAIEQLNGVRGGGKSRCYQGDYSRQSRSDAYRIMGQLLLQEGDWSNPSPFSHPIQGYGFILATSRYRLPDLIREIALHSERRGEYVYRSKRPGLMTGLEELPPLGDHPCWYHIDAHDSRLVRYTWCTPDHLMGCFLSDPRLEHEFVVQPNWPEERVRSYAAIHAQNRWQGINFGSDPDARIFPQCVGKPDKNKPNLSITYLQQVAVQHENVLIVQMNREVPENTAIRVFFSKGMKDRLVQEEGWWFLEEGNSYAAVRINSTTEGWKAAESAWEDEHFLRAGEPYAPILFVTGRKHRFPGLSDFQDWVLAQRGKVAGGCLEFTFEDKSGKQVELCLSLDEVSLPKIEGVPIDLSPPLTYASPFLRSATDSSEISLSFEGKTEILFD
jgi:hypothetical protein